jgi:hypothetical protein
VAIFMERGYLCLAGKNIIKAFEKYLPEMYDVFVAEKEAFNTLKKKLRLNIFILYAPISPSILASWKKRKMYM